MLTKVCKRCGLPKPITNFQLRTKKKQGSTPENWRIPTCRMCIRSSRSISGCCKRCGKPADGTRCDKCQEWRKGACRRTRMRRKLIVIQKYGGKCVYCGESRIVFLTIDHKNNDGAIHRREIGSGNGRIYLWLIKYQFPQDFQVACFNCNCGKAIIGESKLIEILAEGPSA